MPYVAGEVTDGKVKPKHSIVAGETLGAGGLDVGEIAVNAADGNLLVGKSGSIGTVPAAVGFSSIVSLTQDQYDALTPDATTLYIVTPNP